jgi:hypothetical protein
MTKPDAGHRPNAGLLRQRVKATVALAAAFSRGHAGLHASGRELAGELSRSNRSLFKAGTGSATMVTPDQIRERMEVVGNDGLHVGVIDRVEAGEIRLAKNDTPDGLHHFLPLANVEYVDERVHLNRSSIRAMAEWR